MSAPEHVIDSGAEKGQEVTITWLDADGWRNLVLKGDVEIRKHNSGTFDIRLRWANGRDDEHDRAILAIFEGTGLGLVSVEPYGVFLEGHIHEWGHYDEGQSFEPGTKLPKGRDPIEVCEAATCPYHSKGDHLIVPYTPPTQRKGVPVPVRIAVRYSKDES